MTVEQLFNHFEYYPDCIHYEETTYDTRGMINNKKDRVEFFKEYGEYKVVDWSYENSRPIDSLFIVIKR